MKPHEVIKENLEELPDLTCINGAMYLGAVETPCSGRETGECCQNEQTYDEAMRELVKYIIDSQLSLLLSVKEMVGDNMFEDSAQAGQFSMHADGYNNALEDLQALLDEEINKIKELN